MYYFCAICMVNTDSLIDLNFKSRWLFEAMVSPYIEFKECLKSCRILLCLECNRLFSTVWQFQQTMVEGVKNLVGLHNRSNMIIHNLPDIISADTDLLLPVVNEVSVFNTSTNSVICLPNSKNKPPPSTLGKRFSEPNEKAPVNTKRPRKEANDKRQDSDSTISCDSDCCFGGNPDYLPGYYERLVATSQVDLHDYFKNKNDMAVLVPIKNTGDKRGCTDRNESNEIKKTKLNRELYQAIKLALESCSISDFDVAKYEPESESDFDNDFESHHDSNSPYNMLKSLHHDSSPHHNSKSPHLDAKLKSPLNDSESSPHYAKSLHDSASPHHNSKLSHLETYSLHHDSKSPHRDSTYRDSESTLSCESDYEDPEHFPNISLAKAFSGVAEGRGVSEDEQNKAHLVLNPPSEWPCTAGSCFCPRRHDDEGNSDCTEIIISDEDTRPDVKPAGKRRRKECKLCEKTFVSLYALWEHYESEHVLKECCNGTVLKNGNLTRLFKVPDKPIAQKSEYNCAECGIDCRNQTAMRLHVATLRHKLRSQWRFQCDTCKRKFLDKTQVAEHIEREHLAKEGCPICAATFLSLRALRKHTAAHVAHKHAQALAHMTAHGARKRRTRKLTDTEKTPVSRNVLDADTTATVALSNRRVKRRRKRTRWTHSKQHARNSDMHTNVQETQEQTQGTQSRVQLASNSDTNMNVQCIRKRTQGTQSRKQLATDSGTHTNVQGTQEQSRVQPAPNSDTQIYVQLQWLRKRTRGTRKRTQRTSKRTQGRQPRKQLATDCGTHTNMQGTKEQPQETQSPVQLLNSDTHYERCAMDTHKRTQTVGELRKMQMTKERTQVGNERLVNFYLDRFNYLEASGGISRALTHPPEAQRSPSCL